VTTNQPLVAPRSTLLIPHQGQRPIANPSSERFDRITRLTSRVLTVPVAFVCLLADGVVTSFRSTIGLRQVDLPGIATFVSDTVTSSEGVLTVEPLTVDERFALFPCLAGRPRPHAFAGQVLRLGDEAVGVLGVFDHSPRRFDEAELAALVDLACWAEAELRSAEEHRIAAEHLALRRRSEMVLAGMAEGVVGVDGNGRVVSINPAASAMLEWQPKDLLGVDLHAVTHSRHSDGTPFPADLCPVSEVLRTGGTRHHLAGSFIRSDGTPFPADWSVGAVQDDNAVVGAVVVFDDASRRVQVDMMKEEFTAVVSHELRTPLTSLTGALELLASGVMGSVADEAKPLVDIALRNAQRLARLVNDILDLERSATGQMPLSRLPVHVGELMRAAAATVQGTAIATGIGLEIEPVVATVWGDEHRLIQVLTNLLGNALRFSRPGSSVRLHGDQDLEFVRVSVSDDGVGIPPESLDRVFDRFWQVDGSSRRQHGGSGLGLAIAKNIVEAHGGTLQVESEVGTGSTFTVALPLRSQKSPVRADRRRKNQGMTP